MEFKKVFAITFKVWLSLLIINGTIVTFYYSTIFLYKQVTNYKKYQLETIRLKNLENVELENDENYRKYLNSVEYQIKKQKQDSMQTKNIEILKKRGEIK